MTVERTLTRKEVRSYDHVDHRSVSVERHCGTHVYHAICGPRVDEATRVDLKKRRFKENGRQTYASRWGTSPTGPRQDNISLSVNR